MDSRNDLMVHALEIPLSTNGLAKWTINAVDVPQLVRELAAAEAAITEISRLAGRIVSVTCGVPVEPKEGVS